MPQYDPGPPAAVRALFEACPSYEADKKHFWYDWGPIFYRGRLDGSARLLCVASDPGPTERLVGRTLVGDAGQRVQGFLTKLGLTKSYVCLNALVYALFPSHGYSGKKVLQKPEHTAWRNKLFDKVCPNIEAIVAFGGNAQIAIDLWPGKGAVPVFDVPHPSSHTASTLISAWKSAIPQIRAVVTPDKDGDPTLANYGASLKEADYARIPYRDLPFGLPDWVGDDSWGRTAKPKHSNSVSRPGSDTLHTIVWIAPNSH